MPHCWKSHALAHVEMQIADFSPPLNEPDEIILMK